MSIESVIPSNYLILCRPLYPLPSIFPSIRVFSNEPALCIRWPKYQSFNVSPSSEYSGLISFRIDWFDLLAVQRTLKSSPASIFRCSAFFVVQLSHPKLSRLVKAFLPRSKCLNFMAAVNTGSDFGAQENRICHCFYFPSSISQEVKGLDAMILVL